MEEMTEQEKVKAAFFYMEHAILVLSAAAQNASTVKGNLYRKIDGIRNRLSTLLSIERNKLEKHNA